jgi:hypothetical protein
MSVMILLIAAGAISGFLLGRLFRVYALIPAVLVLTAPAFYLAQNQGFGTGLLAFALSAAAMQVCYFASVMAHLLAENTSIKKTPPEGAPSPSELGSLWSSNHWLR